MNSTICVCVSQPFLGPTTSLSFLTPSEREFSIDLSAKINTLIISTLFVHNQNACSGFSHFIRQYDVFVMLHHFFTFSSFSNFLFLCHQNDVSHNRDEKGEKCEERRKKKKKKREERINIYLSPLSRTNCQARIKQTRSRSICSRLDHFSSLSFILPLIFILATIFRWGFLLPGRHLHILLCF